jgi:formate hydrogenlyase subunit 3/multisubunit Na+/H+ antiporter MnhD subunit
MLAGVEASPGDIALTVQAGTMLGLGFAFLLAVFPLYNWIPMLAEEASPYSTGFLLWALPTFTAIFALGFLDRYAWLRTSSQLSSAIQFTGILMVASAGMFASVQKHAGRMMGYGAIVEAGLIILAMGLKSREIIVITFLLLIPRGLELAIWSLGLSVLKGEAPSLKFSDLRGLARKYPIAAGSIILAHLSVAGFPLLAGYPPRLALWQELARNSLTSSFWVFLGFLGLLTGAIRTLAVLVMADEHSPWNWSESRLQIFMLGTGVLCLFILGVFPQTLVPFLSKLPAIFEHLGP